MDARSLAAYGARVRRFRKTIAEGDLVNAVNGSAFDVVLGALPSNAYVVSHSIKLTAYFTGGGATTMTCSIGTAAAPTDIMTALDVFSTTALNKPLQGTLGAAPRGEMGATNLVARFTPNAGANLSALTAGSCVIDVLYLVPDDRA